MASLITPNGIFTSSWTPHKIDFRAISVFLLSFDARISSAIVNIPTDYRKRRQKSNNRKKIKRKKKFKWKMKKTNRSNLKKKRTKRKNQI
jgi:hypothetical protein